MLELDVFSWNFAITALDIIQICSGFIPVVSYGSAAFSRLKRLAHASSPCQSMLLVLHQILLHQSLAILNRVDFDLFWLLVNIGTRKKSVGILFKGVSLLNSIILNSLQLTAAPIILLFVNLQSGDGHLKQLILPFGIKSLLMIELLFFDLLFVLLFPHLDVSL